MRTRGQQRAEYALKEITRDDFPADREDFKTFSAGAPTMILKNGFGQALAFWLAKGTDKHLKLIEDDKHIILLRIVLRWLIMKNFVSAQNEREFLEKISKMDQKPYLTCQQETLKLLEWVKRFANADLGGA